MFTARYLGNNRWLLLYNMCETGEIVIRDEHGFGFEEVFRERWADLPALCAQCAVWKDERDRADYESEQRVNRSLGVNVL
jgi:hypothetical protein